MYSVLLSSCLFFFFKQKTAYEMRISDWSSDVCSSDLRRAIQAIRTNGVIYDIEYYTIGSYGLDGVAPRRTEISTRQICRGKETQPRTAAEIGRASCRERVCQYV